METITIEASINAPIIKVWEKWTLSEHIINWNFASDDWCCPRAENDLRVGGKFSSRMEAKDKSFGFDFGGTYDAVKKNELISYVMEDGRKATVKFTAKGITTQVVTVFQPENENPIEMQKGGWQAILNNFKKYAEQK